MAIKIIDKKPDIYITQVDYDRYSYDYENAYRHYAGKIPTLEEYIRRRIEDSSKQVPHGLQNNVHVSVNSDT